MTQDVLDTMIGAGQGARDPEAAKRHFDAGRAAETDGNRIGAIDAYRQAITVGAEPEAMFRLAYCLDLVGEEDEAVALYEQLSLIDRPHVNSLLNLAVIYEDRGDINRAEKCLKQIIDTKPNHERARLFWKDVQASKDMYYDEEQARDLAKHNALLDTPVTDFELSVRARNCLKKMQIRTLGDLLKISEAELLSYKNFGETSLQEIKEILRAKNLRLGMGQDELMSAPVGEVEEPEVVSEEMPDPHSPDPRRRPVTELDLSVRSRRIVDLLKIRSIGDLANKTEAELLACPNFGQTSLNEIKTKLDELGLSLRG